MPDFKYAIFMFECAALPDDQRVVNAIAEVYGKLPHVAPTVVHVAHTLEEAAKLIDEFKAQTCGSPYTLAVINLNMLTDVREIDFLLRSDVLGDPRTIFLASLKYMLGEAYALARDKIQRENLTPGLSTSCLDCYGPSNLSEVPSRIADLAMAYLREVEELEQARREGRPVTDPSATAILRKSQTAFYRKTMKSGLWKATGSGTSGRVNKPGGGPDPATGS